MPAEDWFRAIVDALALSPDRLLTLALDPDGLLAEPESRAALDAQDPPVHLLTLDPADPIAFRHAYESEYRSRWDDGEPVRLLVRLPGDDPKAFPYDLLARAGGMRQVRNLALYTFFPHLAYPVLQELARHDRAALAALYDVYQAHPPPQRLGPRRSRRYLLEHLYGVDPEAIRTPADLVRYLLQRHDRKRYPPPSLDQELLAAWQPVPVLASLPLEEWLRDEAALCRYLEAVWPGYLARQGLPVASAPPPEDAAPLLPALDDREVQVRLDTMFLEGRLRPVRLAEPHPVYGWMQAGVYFDPAAYATERLRRLLALLDSTVPGPESPHRDWLDFARSWAEGVRLRFQVTLDEETARHLEHLHDRIEDAFARWLRSHYARLASWPPIPAPLVGDRVAEFLAYRLRQGTERLALLVVDGLAWDQWLVLRDEAGLEPLEEGALFACLPTLTPVARQALLAGRRPARFPETWNRTDAEERRWREFWDGESLPPSAVLYLRDPDPPALEDALADRRVRALAVVLTVVDRMMHGMQLGTAGLHQQVRQWAGQGMLAQTVRRLREAGFACWLTADHGNIEGTGIGVPQEGVLVEKPGQRVRIYTDPRFRQRAHEQFPQALAWTPAGLPEGVHLLLAPGRAAFLRPGQRAVCHGGLALEEVVVPWIRLG
jgi:hypothetical protein